MSEVQLPSSASLVTRVIQPRQPYIEVAELLASSIVRARTASASHLPLRNSEVSLGFSANQRVNANPSFTQGVSQ